MLTGPFSDGIFYLDRTGVMQRGLPLAGRADAQIEI